MTQPRVVRCRAFLAHLARLGFEVGVDRHLAVERLLDQVGHRCHPGELKTLLCPLLARDREQQEAFYNAFDTFYPLLASAPPPPPTDDLDRPGSTPAPETASPPRRWWTRSRLAVAAVAAVAVAAVAAALLVPPCTWKDCTRSGQAGAETGA